ncbi:MAG: ferrous iron transporter B [Lentisphaerales bacterium]|jgi:ferrous iron transport protein B|nr:MAG: ferrous iron transporter B [Lentisphaerales bacterium]
MKVLLAGNPNTGKSVVFNRLTGANVITANYPGTTVEFTEGRLRVGDKVACVVDVPGTYSLDPDSRAEEVAAKILREMSDDDLIVNVVDSTNLERSLNLTLQLVALKKRMVIALNFWDETQHTGIQIDVPELEKLLGVACVPLVAITGVGVKALVEEFSLARVSPLTVDREDRWREIGCIIERVQTVLHRHHTLRDRLADASVAPVTGPAIGLAVMALSFQAIRFIGEGLISLVFDPLFERAWAPLMMRLSAMLGGRGLLHSVLIGNLIDGQIDFGESFGVLTTGLYVPFAAVLPYVFAFYLALSFLEDSGYLPRLAVLTDTVMHKIGLHGMGIIPMLLGFGCNVPGALSGRILEGKRARFIALTLMAITVPCMAQIAMIVGLAGEYGMYALFPIFGTLFLAWVVGGLLLNATIKGESPAILVDIPPYRIPYMRGLLKKVWMRIIWFLREAVPWVLGGVMFVNILHALGVISAVGRFAAPVITGVLGLPEEAVGGLVVGFLRKDVAVGMLAPLNLNLRQMIVACVVLSMYFPCVATFAIMVRELGPRGMLKAAGIMVLSALVTGGLLNVVLLALIG